MRIPVRADQLAIVPAIAIAMFGGAVAGFAWIVDHIEIIGRAQDLEDE